MNSACPHHSLHYRTSKPCLPQLPVAQLSEAREGQDLCHDNIEPYFLTKSKDRKTRSPVLPVSAPSTTASGSGPAFILGIPSI